MSTVKVNAITDASGGNTATINSMTPTADSLQGFRNRIINGDMRIAQRGTAAVTGNANYPVDRFAMYFNNDGAYSAQQSSTAPTGFTNSISATTTTADGSLSATQFFFMRHNIEGLNVADLAWGSASAKTITLSFQVRSSLTGTFGGSLQNSAEDRAYPFTYTISSANTSTSISITIPGDTSGTWLTTNGVGIRVNFGLGVGSTYSGTAGAWAAAASIYSATGATSVIGTLNATWYITGVQLEVGSVATPFERRPYGTEILLCQRYFQRAGQYATYAGRTGSTTQVRFGIPLNTYLRATPTVSNSGEGVAYSGGARVIASGGSVTPDSYTNSTNLTAVVSGFSGLTDDRIYNINFNTADLFISAEL